ncbi:MAG: acyl CoA--acetate/3-ketoacid CoA transferase subunit alpha [Clostridia bacterium]|nr:acyl CoA--acetate/3-ketoacid CoA transferase subunit alpha [Clostridia bacterium]
MTDVAARVREASKAGRLVAFGGSGLHRKPLRAAEAIAEAAVPDLRLLAPLGGPEVDLLVLAGLVRRVVFSYVGFEFLGVAPAFRRAREEGAIEVEEWSEFAILAGLRAGVLGLPFHPLPGPATGDLARTAPLAEVRSPYAPHEPVAVVPALAPAVAIVHVPFAREDGTAFVPGDPYADRLVGLAADELFVTCDELVGPGEVPGPALFLAAEVTGVVPAPGGSCFTASPPFADLDVRGAIDYLESVEARLARPSARAAPGRAGGGRGR